MSLIFITYTSVICSVEDTCVCYLVTPGNEQIGVSPKNYTAEYNSEAMKQYEQVKKGNIAIIKHTDDGQTQIETRLSDLR